MPSLSLKTLVTVDIAKLDPDIKSTLKLVHFPVVSKFHVKVQSPPSLKVWPGPGAVGRTPPAMAEPAATKIDRTRPDIILVAVMETKE